MWVTNTAALTYDITSSHPEPLISRLGLTLKYVEPDVGGWLRDRLSDQFVRRRSVVRVGPCDWRYLTPYLETDSPFSATEVHLRIL